MNRRSILVLCLAFVPLILSSPPYVTNNGKRTAPIFPRAPKTFDIDLDASYEDQWKSIILHFEPQLLAFVQGLGINAQVDLEILDAIDYPIIEAYDRKLALELSALSKLLNLSFTELFILNLLYDITAQCTSILVQDPEGNVYHGRNLDFPFSPALAGMIFHGRYFRNGELVYEAISLAGYAGLITGMKPNAYSFSIDQYLIDTNATMLDQAINVALDIIQAYQKKLSPPMVARRAFETIYDFKDFVSYLQSTDTVSRVFYIVGGALPGQGAVITKFRSSTENTTYLEPDVGKWYVVQTNYIGDEADPSFDNRATAAEDWLNSIGQSKISKELLLNEVMAVYPIFNNQTIHTTIMQPNDGYMNTTIWGWQKRASNKIIV